VRGSLGGLGNACAVGSYGITWPRVKGSWKRRAGVGGSCFGCVSSNVCFFCGTAGFADVGV